MRRATVFLFLSAFLSGFLIWGANPADFTNTAAAASQDPGKAPPVAPGQSPAPPELRTVINAGHSSTVSSLDWSRDGKFVVTGSWDGTIRLWEAKSLRLIKVMAEETRRVEAVALSPDGKYIASLHAVHQPDAITAIVVRIWDVMSGAVVKSVQTSQAPPPIYDRHDFLSWSPDSKSLAVMAQVNQVAVLDLATGRTRLTLAGAQGRITAVSWSPDGKFIAAGGQDEHVRIWDAASGELKLTLPKPSPGLINFLAWNPNGAFLAAAGKDLAVWEIARGTAPLVFGKAKGWDQAAWSPDGKFLAGNNGDIHLWEFPSGTPWRILKGAQFGYRGMTWSPDSQHLATCGEDLRIWQTGSGRVTKKIGMHQPSARQVDWSPDGRLLFMAGLGELFVWEASSGKLLRRFDKLLSYVGHITWSPDKKTVAWSSGYEEMKGTWIWPVGSPGPRQLPAIRPVWSPDGQKLATGAGRGWETDQIKIWEAHTGKLLRTLGNPKETIRGFAWSPDGRYIAASCSGKVARIWDAASGISIRHFKGQVDEVDAVLWSKDGKYLIAGGPNEAIGQENMGRVWEVNTGRVVKTLGGPGESMWSLALSPDGALLATGSEDGQVRLWETKNFSMVRAIQEKCSPALIWSPDGKFLAAHSQSGYAHCRDQDVRIYDRETGVLLATLPGRPGEDVRSVSWSPTSQFLLSGAEDGTLTVWDIKTGKALARLYAFPEASVAVTPEGFFSGAGQFSRRVHFVQSMAAYDFNQFYDAFYRPDLVERKLRGEDISKDTLGLNVSEAMQNPPPAVEILDPRGGTRLTGRTATVKVRIQDAGGRIGDIRLYHNGKLISSEGVYRLAKGEEGAPPPALEAQLDDPYLTPKRGTELRQVILGQPDAPAERFQPREGTLTKEYGVNLMNGENVISLCAFNGSNLVLSEMVSVGVDCLGPPRPPELHILTVGLNDAGQPQLPVLTCARKDAQDLAALLEKAARPFYHKVHVRVLADAEATKPAIVQAALDLAAGMAPEDVFVLAVAAHGLTRDDLYYLFTRQTPGNRPGDQTLSSPEIMELFKSVTALKQVLILDTCQAGGLNQTVSGLYDARVSVLAKALGMHVLAGASSRQEALDDYQGNGLFTHFLLKGLKGAADANGDKRVTVVEAGAYLEKAVKEASRGRQVPWIRTFGLDLPLSQVAP
jgi:WD40 repeat protein